VGCNPGNPCGGLQYKRLSRYGGSRSLELYEFPILTAIVVAAPRAPVGVFAVSAAVYHGVPLLPALPALPRHNLVRGGCKVLHPHRGVVPLPQQVLELPLALFARQLQVVRRRRH
jgi:hypothetical protein